MPSSVYISLPPINPPPSAIQSVPALRLIDVMPNRPLGA